MPFFSAAWVVDSMLGQLGRAVKAIDSKSIGVTRVSSSLTAVDLFRSVSPAAASLIAVWSFVDRCLSIDRLKDLINLAASVDLTVL